MEARVGPPCDIHKSLARTAVRVEIPLKTIAKAAAYAVARMTFKIGNRVRIGFLPAPFLRCGFEHIGKDSSRWVHD